MHNTLNMVESFAFLLIFLHHFGESGADQSGRNGKDSDAEHTDDTCYNTTGDGDRRRIGKVTRVADILRKRP